MSTGFTYNDTDYIEEVMKARFGFKDEGDDSTDDLYSSYWMGQLPNHNRDLITLASYRRAVARFVKIATRKNIPVVFNVKGHSYVTDLENKVILSAVCKNKDFDSAVGLALHESSHILWTDWEAIKNLMDSHNCKKTWDIPQDVLDEATRLGINYNSEIREIVKSFENYIEDRRIDDLMIKMIPGYEPYYKALYRKYFGAKIITAGLQSSYHREPTPEAFAFRITNHINPASDRNALPGLGEIIDLIDVNNISRLENTQEVIDVAIEVTRVMFKNIPTPSQEENQNDEDGEDPDNDGQGDSGQGGESSKNPMDDYEDGGDLDDSDPGNSQPNFDRPSSDEKSDDVENDDSDENKDDESEASDIDGGDGSSDNEDEFGESEDGDTDGSSSGADGSGDRDENSDKDGNESGNGESDDEDSDDMTADTDDLVGEDDIDSDEAEEDDEPEEELEDLSSKEQKKLAKELKTQSDMLDGEVKKQGLDKKDAKILKDIEDAGTTVEHVQGDSKTGMNVYVVRKLTKDIMVTFGIGKKTYIGRDDNYESKYDVKIDDSSQRAVLKGTRLGKVLAKRLQVRNETKIYRSKRKTSGKIDRRLLHQLGIGTSQIFETINKDQYGNAQVHISIDASGSMSGEPWENTITSAVAIAYAASRVENLEVVISFRGTYSKVTDRRRKYGATQIPLMVVAYDSRVDKFKKIQQLFPYISTFGITPEGLCYEAVMKDILSSMSGKDGYFINFSDGFPNMTNDKVPAYKRMNAKEIAKYNVDKIRANGVKILSFYLTDDDTSPDLITFKFMYGKEATYIDVTQVVPLARELNKLFLKK
jgi:hypothetical protein